jgi:uncharacterized protein
MPKLLCSIACNLDTSILQAALPLLEAEKVQAIEWSFDTTFQYETIPTWFKDLLHAFSDEQRLIGHGVFFSLFSGRWLKEQDNWLLQLKKVSSEYQFDHITEHFGFMTGADFHAGAPISIPLTQTTLNLGIDRLKRIQNVCKCPVGLENLAFSVALDEVKTHGAFLNQLVESIDGFIILDLHNLYCQMHNFEIQYDEIINLYPLEKVREIHISGGSWEGVLTKPDKKIRRDTHDDCVPDVVFELLKKTIPKCPHLKYIVLEQLGTGLKTEASRFAFQQDFLKLEQIVDDFNQILDSFPAPKREKRPFLPILPHLLPQLPIEDHALHAQQIQLSHILETAKDYQQAKMLLQNSDLAHTAWKIEDWASEMLETALAIAQKWKLANT